MQISTIAQFALHNICISMWEFCAEHLQHLPKEKWEEFDRLYRLQSLHIAAVQEGWEEFDWKKVHDAGWLSSNDYKVFAKELNGLTEEQWWRDRGKEPPKRKSETQE